MGKFVYGTPIVVVEFDDRTLAHLKVVIATKLHRSESFMFTWDYGTESGSGHSSVWLHPAIPIQFDFLGNREPSLNRLWLEELTKAANSTGGLRIVPEPEPDGVAPPTAEPTEARESAVRAHDR